MTSFNFQARDYGSTVADIVTDRLCELGPGRPNRDVADRLQTVSIQSVFGDAQIVNRDLANCCLAGLWLWQDFLDESHTISQSVSNSSGSFWHGIMHRREPDYSNAKYWFRRVGDHPVFDDLRVAAAELAQTSTPDSDTDYLATQTDWDPFRFVDSCQYTYRSGSAAEQLCQQVAQAEWQLLFDYCYRGATGA